MIDTTKPYCSITVGDDGEIKIEAHNFQGKGCMESVESLRKDLGLETTGSQIKPEMNKPQVKIQQSITH